MAHVEAMGDKSLVLFDYKNRDPLSHNAKAVMIEGPFSEDMVRIFGLLPEKGKKKTCMNG